jgi:hypothetical protein
MKISQLWQVIACLAFWQMLAPAADLSKIDRTLSKEPSYKGKPKYCLLVFGPESKTRVWLVVDGNILYVDRNGDGDLTEKNERIEGQTLFEKKPGSAPQPNGVVFNVEKLIKWNGKDARLMVVRSEKSDDDDVVNVFAGAGALANTAPFANGVLKFSDRAQDAPVIHFNGPLKMALRGEQTLVRDEMPQDFQSMIGTPGIGEGSFAALNVDGVPKDIHPVAEFEFSNRKAGGDPIKAKIILSQRC